MPDPQEVRSMFGRIAGRYDLLNRVLSAGIDKRWRRAAVRKLEPLEGLQVVDVCCGTGDLSLELSACGAQVLGVDFTPEMLQRTTGKLPRRGGKPLFARGDAMRLPLHSHSADAASIAFGIRNVADRLGGLRELYRIVKPGGQLLVLEFTCPPGPILGRLYRTYFTRVLPLIGRTISGDGGAYEYLPRTVLAWPEPEAFQREMESVGFVDCGHQRLTRGIACLHWGRVPLSDSPPKDGA